jgi:hypothetical protein
MSTAPEELLFALCHELGNILAAIRLQSRSLDAQSGARVSELTQRAGSLVALVRPLLSPPPASVPLLDPLELLEALRRGLDDAGGARVRIELASAVDLPGVAIEGETLHHLLMADLLAALENLPGGERLRLSAEASPDGVSFVLEAPGEAAPEAPALKLTGCALTRALAAAVLGERGGGVAVSGCAAGLRVCFRLPAGS